MDHENALKIMCATSLLLLLLFFTNVASDDIDARLFPKTEFLDHESQLFVNLFHEYDFKVRPVCGNLSAAVVQMGGALRQILEVDSKNQILSAVFWMHLVWFDCRIVWNATDYGGIGNISASAQLIWTPDLVLYDSVAEMNLPHHLRDYNARIYSNGLIQLTVPVQTKSACKIDISDFPFDRQNCSLQFGPWAYNGGEVYLTTEGHDNDATDGELSYYVQNGEWNLLDYGIIPHAQYYVCCPDPFTDVTFHLLIQRRPLFYMFNLAFPVVLMVSVHKPIGIGLSVVIVIIGFLLPVAAGEKLVLHITVLLSLTVFLLVVSEMTPTTSETLPLIGICFGIIMVMVSMSCMGTVVVLNLHYRGEHGDEPPVWLQKLCFVFLAKLLRCRKMDIVGSANISSLNVSKKEDSSTLAFGNPGASSIDSNQSDSCVKKQPPSDLDLRAVRSNGTVPSSELTYTFKNPNDLSPCYTTKYLHSTVEFVNSKWSIELWPRQRRDSNASVASVALDPNARAKRLWKDVAKIMDQLFSFILFICFISLILFTAVSLLTDKNPQDQ